MGFFNRNKKEYAEVDLDKTAAARPEETTTPEEPPVEAAESQENWIWVEGYKGTDKDMKAYGDFQYELGKQYDYEGEIEICAKGFHFSRAFKDVFNYYAVQNSNRFFKVKALVKESDYEKYGEYITVPTHSLFGTTLKYERIDKLVAKSIILEEEVSKADIVMAYYQCNQSCKSLPPEEYWNTMICDNGYEAAYEDWQVDNLIKAGYSPIFAKCIYQDNKTEKALAIADQEGVSMDMKVWYIYH